MPYKNKADEIAYRKKRNLDPTHKLLKKEYNRAYKEKNSESINTYMRQWVNENKDVIKKYVLRRRYGITVEELGFLLSSQNNCCAICGISADNFTRSMHVDHCHKTKKVRGVLCVSCNTALGHFKEDANLIYQATTNDFNLLSSDSKKGLSKFKDNIEVMQKAIKYLHP